MAHHVKPIAPNSGDIWHPLNGSETPLKPTKLILNAVKIGLESGQQWGAIFEYLLIVHRKQTIQASKQALLKSSLRIDCTAAANIGSNSSS